MLLGRLLNRLIKTGTLIVIDAYGKTHIFGESRPAVTIKLHHPSLHWKLFFNPLLYTGEAYMDGTLTVEDGSLYDFLALTGQNRVHTNPHPATRIIAGVYRLLRRIHQFNPASRAIKNVAHHYDLSRELYDLFLDSARQYSCAYFPTGRETLDTAQRKKLEHIAAKLLVEPKQKILDIGSGWGGLALHLARHHDCEVTGLTLSQEQIRFAVPRAEEDGLANKVRYHLRDYRDQTGTFDRIVSVGMFEHVGINHFDEYFTTMAGLLKDEGVALLHTIGRSDGPGVTNAWIRKYIFPGGYIPALSEIVGAVERAGLVITDVEVLRLHYAETLRHWRERFMRNWNKAKLLYDERFCRMWEFYLAASEASFRYMDNVVFQIQIAKRQDAVPLTRDYIHAYEHGESESPGQTSRHTGARAA